MPKTSQKRSFDDVLAELGNRKFDVSGAHQGSTVRTDAKRVSKYGCAAEIGSLSRGKEDSAVSLLVKPGWLLGGEITRLVDKGYQKFLRSSKLEIPATAAILRALHDFEMELDLATGEMALYNESLGTTSDVYLYDRVAGRPDTK